MLPPLTSRTNAPGGGLFSGGIIDKMMDGFSNFEDRQSKANEEALQGFIRERDSMQNALKQERESRKSFLQNLKDMREQNQEMERQSGLLRDRMDGFNESMRASESSRKGLLKQLRDERQARAAERQAEAEIRAAEAEERQQFIFRLNKRCEAEQTFLGRLKEFTPIKNMFKRGIGLLIWVGVFFGVMILILLLLVAVVMWTYNRMRKKLDLVANPDALQAILNTVTALKS